MHVTAEQVGQKIVCPDCRVPMVVPPPVKREVESRWNVERVGKEGEYALREEDDQPADGLAAEGQPYALAECPVCGTRLHAAIDHVGRKIVCPDCDRPFVVRPPPPAKRKFDPRDEAGDDYELGEAIEVPEPRVRVDYRRLEGEPDHTAAISATSRSAREQPDAPRWTFFSGIFTLPFYSGAWQRWIALSALAIFVFFLAIKAAEFTEIAASKAFGIMAAGYAALGMTCYGLSAVFGVIWIVVAAGICLAILRDTAFGNNRIQEWPDTLLFVDWCFDSFYVINSLVLSALPLIVAAHLWEVDDLVAEPFLSASTAALFPFLLLSMLEANSPMNPFSWSVCRSLVVRWWAWGMFYIETTVILLATAWLIGNVWPIMKPLLAMALLAPVVVAVLLIYFRLLGRLAWCLARESARGKRPSEEAEPSDADEDEEVDGPDEAK
jgi:hypothetical protein